MPDRAPGGFDGAFRRGMFAGQMRYPAKCMTVPEEMALSASVSRRWKNTKYTSQYALVRLPRGRVPAFAAFEAACTDSSRPPVVRPSIDRQCRFEPAGIGGHDLLHHGDEALLIGLAEIGYRLKVSLARGHLHLPQ
jgi:hypothetical protein